MISASGVGDHISSSRNCETNNGYKSNSVTFSGNWLITHIAYTRFSLWLLWGYLRFLAAVKGMCVKLALPVVDKVLLSLVVWGKARL